MMNYLSPADKPEPRLEKTKICSGNVLADQRKLTGTVFGDIDQTPKPGPTAEKLHHSTPLVTLLSFKNLSNEEVTLLSNDPDSDTGSLNVADSLLDGHFSD